MDGSINGWTFNTVDVQQMAERIGRLASCTERQWAVLGIESKRILTERSATSQFVRGLADLIRLLQ